MEAYLVQVRSIAEADRWRTVCETADEDLAIGIRDRLENFASGRRTRVVVRSRLLFEGGSLSLLVARRDLENGWSDRELLEGPFHFFRHSTIRKELKDLRS